MPPTNTRKPATPTIDTTPPSAAIEPSNAEAAFQSLADRMAEQARDRLATVNVDVQIAAVFALGVARFITTPAVHARFAKLDATGEFDGRCVTDLATVAQSAWYARHRFLLADATHSDAQLPVTLVDEATLVRGRMLKLVDYWLGEDPAASLEINAIRPGVGHQDLANDLVALASLYDRHAALLAEDRKLYQKGDAASAKRLADLILAHLGAAATQEQSLWAGHQARAFTLLLSVYDEVQRGGRFLFARDNADTRFPSLIAIARNQTSRPNKEPPPAGDGTPGGNDGPPPA